MDLKTITQENRLLSRATFVTSVGDWVTYFLFVFYLYRITDSVLVAAYSLPVRSLGTGVGSLLGASLLSRWQTRRTMLATQLISAAVSGSLALAIALGVVVNPVLVLFSSFTSAMLKYLFDVARETHSKCLGHSNNDHRTLQSQLLQGLTGAQFVGPLFAVLLLKFIPIWSLFLIDGASFLASAGLIFLLRPNGPRSLKTSGPYVTPWVGLSEIRQYPKLMRLFWLRTFSHWIPISMVNYLLFLIVTHKFGKNIEYSVLVYSMTGLGGLLASTFLMPLRASKDTATHNRLQTIGVRIKSRFIGMSDGRLAIWSLLSWVPTKLVFVLLPSFWATLPFIIMSGACNNGLAVSTQSLRRRLCPSDQFARLLATETMTSRLIDWVVGSVTAVVVARGLVSPEVLYGIGSLLFVVTAALHVGIDPGDG